MFALAAPHLPTSDIMDAKSDGGTPPVPVAVEIGIGQLGNPMGPPCKVRFKTGIYSCPTSHLHQVISVSGGCQGPEQGKDRRLHNKTSISLAKFLTEDGHRLPGT